MRVLHLNAGNMYGGVETFLTTLVREGAATPGMRSQFAVCFDDRFSAELMDLGTPPHHLGEVKLSRPHTLVRARRALSDLLDQESIDVVVCHQPWTCVVFGGVVRAGGFPLVLWVHMAGDGTHWLERLARRAAPDVAVCNSRFTAECAATWLPEAQIEYAYPPVTVSPVALDKADRTALRHSLSTGPDDVVIVQVSRLEELKGQHVLLDGLARLRDVPDWTCWIVGGAQRPEDEDFLRRLHSLANMYGLESRVRFLGERHDVPAVLASADIYCQPNTAPEAFGLTFVEALLAGLPVVTSAMGGACEIVDESCGVLVPPRDARTLAATLRPLIEDRALRLRLGAGGRGRASALCAPEHQMRRIEQVLSRFVRVESIAG